MAMVFAEIALRNIDRMSLLRRRVVVPLPHLGQWSRANKSTNVILPFGECL
jgi:hypothetical protein